jgi:hypothetical protein
MASITTGPKTTEASLSACEAKCAADATCEQFTFNTNSNSCFLSAENVFNRTFSDHKISGCDAAVVTNCSTGPTPVPTPPVPTPAFAIPSWTALIPDPGKPLGGFTQIPGVVNTEIYHGDQAVAGAYNHAAMIDYHHGIFLIAWKNGAESEDKSGQRILYAQSTDGATFTKTDGKNILFPSMTTSSHAGAMFVGPPIHLNGRQYVGASPGTPTGAADGAQFCLWPDPIDAPRRNCGPAHGTEYADILIMREVRSGTGGLGPLFWANAANAVPGLWAAAGAAAGIVTLNQTAAQTQADLALMFGMADPGPGKDLAVPCGPASEGSLKCEACPRGCHLYDDNGGAPVGNERTHYTLPSGGAAAGDAILYRCGSIPFLFASMRANPSLGQRGWSQPLQTTIPNDESNMNAGALPDGRVFLTHNSVFRAKDDAAPPVAALAPPAAHAAPAWQTAGRSHGSDLSGSGYGTLRFRDPLTIATSVDGLVFDKAYAVASCTNLSATSTCAPRVAGGGKNPGPSYPQGLAVTDPAPLEHQVRLRLTCVGVALAARKRPAIRPSDHPPAY